MGYRTFKVNQLNINYENYDSYMYIINTDLTNYIFLIIFTDLGIDKNINMLSL